ncbi:MAG: hypothetical protein K0R38_2845 [Polyangiaceae bacterium]|jgi:MYXO-CTERM domain-containing protein|nr:hypothetical protein [Polyangiaceae bacterium]
MHVRRRFWRASGLLAALLATAPAYAVCGDGVWEEEEPCDDGNDVPNDACNQCRLSCATIATATTTHTCGHGADGPFVSLPAQSYPGVVFTDISASHTYFTLTLSGEPGSNRSGVLYSPGSDGPYPFYLKEQYPLSVLPSTGDEVPVLFEHAVECAKAPESLTWVKVYELVRSETYTIVFGPADSETVAVAIEYIQAAPQFEDRDGDAHGGALAGLNGCEYEMPTVDTAGDCDDDDADIYPGAAERCDGADNDCSGDEDLGQEALCDGSIAGAACVNAGAAIRCGCAVDTDCEGNATCNAAEHLCEAGLGADASSGEGGHGAAGEADVAGAPSDVGRGGTSVGGASTSGAPGDGEPSELASGDKPASDGCSYHSRPSRVSSAGLVLLGAVALGARRRRRAG